MAFPSGEPTGIGVFRACIKARGWFDWAVA